MTHSTLLRVFSYLGFRASRKILGSSSIAVFPSPIPVFAQSRIQSRDSRSPLLIFPMGQASSSIGGYGGADENRSNEGSVDKNASANLSQNEQKPSAEELVDKNVSANVSQDEQRPSAEESVVSPEQNLNPSYKLGMDLVSETSKPEDVKKEDEVEAEKALKLALDELGEPPERPLAGDCCGQGCDVCVWDTYNDELRDYLARRKVLLKKAK